MKQYYLNTPVHHFNDGDRHIAYFPLRSIVLEINRYGVKTLNELLSSGLAATSDNLQFMDALSELELLTDTKKEEMTNSPQHSTDQQKDLDLNTLTLFLTEKCNLQCIYCYANGGTGNKEIPKKYIDAALSFMADHCHGKKNKHLHIAFHGSGEPTMAQDKLFYSIEQAHHYSKKYSLTPLFSIGTNGVMDDKVRELLVSHDFDVSLSLDGFKEQHNVTRPMTNNDSFKEAMNTALYFTDADHPFSVRVTVTKENNIILPEFTEYLFENTTCQIIQLEPVYTIGRAKTNLVLPPTHTSFIDIYSKCMDLADYYDREIMYSGIMYPALRNYFCMACGQSMCIKPDGTITGCYESSSITNNANDPFCFGHIDQNNDIIIDKDKYYSLMRDKSINKNCNQCIARHHCAGDCPAKKMQGEQNNQYRCTLNRELLKLYITKHLDNTGKNWVHFN